ncbi:hypothetical protein BKA56DRAFT_624930 [Ilyonectria sp. MPI-CAGE-AT-0026]|nr:hypothetical protein BKA56DRAFT_624930 [Ilyonectria sp. MPI-CAGE-AT-0026]
MGDSIAEKGLSDGELQMSEIYGQEYGGKVPSIQGIELSPEFQLHRGLKACHISMIAIGSAIGTGLMIGSGKALAQGCIVCGTSTTLFQIIIGRAISGIGGAGVMTMASIIITDSVPKCDFAKIPFFALSISPILISLKDDVDQTPDAGSDDSMQKESFRQKWQKVDYKGALLLGKTVVSLILLLDVAGTSTFSPSVAFLTASVVVFCHLFVFWELFEAETPIFNLWILAKLNATPSYLVDYFQVFAQVGKMFSVPMYCQITQRASATASGAHIVPAVVANTFGALLSGKLMHISHRQKTILVSTGILGASSYLLIFAFWNGHTSFWESLYVIPGGFATGLAQSAAFVPMASCLENQDLAMATGWFFLVSSLGTVSSVMVTNVMLQSSFRRNLERVIEDLDKDNLIEKITSNINNIANLSGELRHIVVDAFVGSLKSGYNKFGTPQAAQHYY